MKKFFVSLLVLIATTAHSQTTDDLLKDSVQKKKATKEPAIVFYHNKVINANTTELVGKGKMDFIVTHNFGDIAGSKGGIKNFFGLDDSKDIRIGFAVGVGKNMDVSLSRLKGVGAANHLVETSIKYRFMQQTVDNSTPFSLAVFVNNTISTVDTAFATPTSENYFQNFGKRTSQVYQLIVAKKIGKVSLQLNPTFLNTGYVLPTDDKCFFSLGGAIRFPVSNRINIIVDYFHPFRSEQSKNSTLLKTTYGGIHGPSGFHDPLSIGLEILTGGHVFHLNFTNAEAISENQFLRRTVTAWDKGQYRWGFNLSRTFSLWREKQ